MMSLTLVHRRVIRSDALPSTLWTQLTPIGFYIFFLTPFILSFLSHSLSSHSLFLSHSLLSFSIPLSLSFHSSSFSLSLYFPLTLRYILLTLSLSLSLFFFSSLAASIKKSLDHVWSNKNTSWIACAEKNAHKIKIQRVWRLNWLFFSFIHFQEPKMFEWNFHVDSLFIKRVLDSRGLLCRKKMKGSGKMLIFINFPVNVYYILSTGKLNVLCIKPLFSRRNFK